MLPGWDGTDSYELSAEVNKCANKEAKVNRSLRLSRERAWETKTRGAIQRKLLALRKAGIEFFSAVSRNLLEAISENEAVHIKCQKIRVTMLWKQNGGLYCKPLFLVR